MERFGYKCGCGIRGRSCIKAYKEELAWAIDKCEDKWLQVVSNAMLLKQLYH